jgi:hypothetical protein
MFQVYIFSVTGDFDLVFTIYSLFINILRHIQCMQMVRAWAMDWTGETGTLFPALQTHHHRKHRHLRYRHHSRLAQPRCGGPHAKGPCSVPFSPRGLL